MNQTKTLSLLLFVLLFSCGQKGTDDLQMWMTSWVLSGLAWKTNFLKLAYISPAIPSKNTSTPDLCSLGIGFESAF